MSRKRAYPESKGSHLAGELERKRARRALKKQRKKQAKMNNGVNGTAVNGQSAKPRGSGGGADGGGGPPKRRRTGARKLRHDLRDVLIAALDRKGANRVDADMAKLNPHMTRHARRSLVRATTRDPEHVFSSTSLNLLTKLAEGYMAPQRELPLKEERKPLGQHGRTVLDKLAPPPAKRPPTLDDILSARRAPPSPSPSADAERITAIVLAVMQTLEAQRDQRPPALAAAQPQTAPADAPEPGIKQFDEMDVHSQRKLLNSMHSRYGAWLKKHYGIQTGEYAAAWDLSYEAYDRQTGAGVKARASSESDRTGERVRPLDLIEQDGDLVRFWKIVRELWEHC